MKAFIGNLKLAHKFVLLGLIAALMLAIPSGGLLHSGLDALSMARAQSAGIGPAGDVLEVVRLTQQHRGRSAGVLAGNAAMVAPREAKKLEVDGALAKAQASLAALGDERLTTLSNSIEADWKALAADVATKAVAGPQSFARHTALIARQLGLMQDVSHSAGIVLVADAAAYYLQAAVLEKLPLVTEGLGQLRARGSALLTRGEASAEERARFEATLSEVQRNWRDTEKLLAQTGRIDAAMGRALGAHVSAARQAGDEVRKLMTDEILQAAELKYPATDYFAATTRAIDEQFKLIDAAFAMLSTKLDQAASAARNYLVGLTLALALLGALALWIMVLATRTTSASVQHALRLAEAVAAGDLRTQVRVQGRDEIAQLLRSLAAMNQSLAGVVCGVRRNAESVASASLEIAQGNQDLSTRTESQAAALEQTAATMDELGSTVRNTAEHAREASALAQGAAGVAQRGSAVVGQVVETMRGINASSRRIADITGTIDGIAFQTNILALNAAVEAARAGEQGRGFAVVAGEVRALAQRAADAAREIKLLIAASVQSVEQGTSQVDQAGATMAEVVSAIQRVTHIVAEISAACSEQSSGVSQVGEAVTQMDHGTQQNAALVEQGAAAAESLRQQAAQLVDLVAVFKVDGAAAAA